MIPFSLKDTNIYRTSVLGDGDDVLGVHDRGGGKVALMPNCLEVAGASYKSSSWWEVSDTRTSAAMVMVRVYC